MRTITRKLEQILKDGKIEEYKQEAKIILCEISGLSLEELLIANEIKNQDKMIAIAKKRAKTKEPIQYILEVAHFMGEKYIVNKNVLIPRDETQILVLKALELIKNKKDKINILDIGLGSGCISCALAKNLKENDIEILGVDISLDAIETALNNISKLDLIRKIVVRKSDLFSKVRNIEKFDLIISNPPYIPLKDKNSLQKEVLFEPSDALFASDEKGIEFYKKIIETAPKFLKKEGFLAFELGINQSAIVSEMLKKDFKAIEITKDLAGIDRVITAQIDL